MKGTVSADYSWRVTRTVSWGRLLSDPGITGPSGLSARHSFLWTEGTKMAFQQDHPSILPSTRRYV